MPSSSSSRVGTLWKKLKQFLLRGFLVWIPLAAVYLVGWLVYGAIQSWIFPDLGWEPRLAALAGVLAVLIATGWIVTRFGVARYVLTIAVERLLERIPVARWVYTGVRQLLEALFSSADTRPAPPCRKHPRC